MTQYPEAWLCRELGMAVVNISLITDYDAGVHEGTEAVNATDVLEVFTANAERIQRVVLDLIGRFPIGLDALGAREALGPDPRRRPHDRRRGHPALRDRAVTDARTGARVGLGPALPIGVCLRTIRAEPGWWLESARRLDAAGYAERLGMGPLHGPRRPDGPGRRGLDRARDGGRRDVADAASARSCSTS